ncbi:MAG: acetyl-CoA carboxylase carboxyltransferase subunit alpha [Actinobacteria bacterium]|nr:MAG: acetyl-CoA carboxylase carboxyltransferase subunit alpha [Actinomycetota bacterium]
MDLKKLEEIPKSYLKEILGSLSKLEKLKKIPFFTGIHFKDAERDLSRKIESYKKVERDAKRVWKIVELSRDENRPQCLDYINGIFEDFVKLSGDRLTGEDRSIAAGLGKINGKTVAVMGHNKGKDIKQRLEYNFGMSIPQGYRKSQRIMRLADRFGFPIVTLIDTPGAYPALEAEDDGQASAIAKSILLMFEVKVPIIAILIGEGGSGGALALAVGNEVAMLENSTYSVISPEGCAAILWKNPSGTKLAARELRLTSRDMLRLKIIDRIIPEPIGGAQNAPGRMVKIVKKYIIGALERFAGISGEELKSRRAKKFESMGFFGTE